MKQGCEVVRDLLGVYEEGLCSEGTRQFVEAHLAECAECRNYWERWRAVDAVGAEVVVEPDAAAEETVVRKSFRKVKRRWLASLVAVLMIFPLLGIALLGVNQVRGVGVCFTNLQEIRQATRFVKLLEQEKFAEAAKMLDFTADYADLHQVEAELDQTYYDRAILVETPEGTWAVLPEFAERHGISETGQWVDGYEGLFFWYGVMYNEPGAAMIPEEVWNRLVEEAEETTWGNEGAALVPRRVAGEVWEDVAGYRRIETAWGNYYLEVTLANSLERDGAVTVLDLIHCSGIVTQEVYEAAREAVMAESEAQKIAFYECYREELALTESEYTAAKRADFAARMEAYQAAGYHLAFRGFGDAFRVDTWWQIEIQVTETGQETNHYSVMLFVENDKINSFVGGGSKLSDHYLGLVEWLHAD